MSFESAYTWLKENTWAVMLALGAIIGATVHVATGGGPWPYPNRYAFTGCLTEPSLIGSAFDFVGFYGAHTICFLFSTILGAVVALVVMQGAKALPSVAWVSIKAIYSTASNVLQAIFVRKVSLIRAEDGFDIERGFEFSRVGVFDAASYRLRRIFYAFGLSDAAQNTTALVATFLAAIVAYSLTTKAVCYSQSNTFGGVVITLLFAGLFVGLPVLCLKLWYFRPRWQLYRAARSQLPRIRDVASRDDGNVRDVEGGWLCVVQKNSSGVYFVSLGSDGTRVRIDKKSLHVFYQATWNARAIGHTVLNFNAKNLLVSEVVAYAKECRSAFDAWQVEALDIGVGSDHVQATTGHVYPEYQWRLRPGLHHRDGRAVEWRDVSPDDIGRLITSFPKSIFRCPASFVAPDTVVDRTVGEGYVRVLNGTIAAGDQWKLRAGLRHTDGRAVEWRDAEDSIIGRPLSDFPKSIVRRPVAPSTLVTEAPVAEGEATMGVGEGTPIPSVPSSEGTASE